VSERFFFFSIGGSGLTYGEIRFMTEIMSDRSIYITTPLYYVNARPHIGHAYTTLLADALARYYRQLEYRVKTLTGTDEHGEKIATKAKEEGKEPKAFVDEYAGAFQSAWHEIGLEFDVFYRTTLPSHYALVSKALQRLQDNGEIYHGTYEGKYCVGCERFRTDQEWGDDGLCPDHRKLPEIRKESNYFFKMSAYQQRLKDFYNKNPEAIQPSQYMKEMLSFLEQPLEDLNISRPTSRLTWGIPLPFDKNYVTYVWFDALLNYPGGLGYTGGDLSTEPSFDKALWKNTVHLIGKDILKTHAIYWPTMLMALGLEPFKHLQVNGYLLMKGMKMSKSLGNVVDPVDIHRRFGVENVRYYFMRDVPYGGDSNFTWEGFVNRCNADLANGLGNLASRTLTLVHKNFEATVPTKDTRKESDLAFLNEIHKLPELFKQEFDACRYHMGLAAFSEAVARCDLYINDNKPWALAKDPAQHDRLAAVLGTAMDSLWTLGVVVASVLPAATLKLRASLGDASPERIPLFEEAKQLLKVGTRLGEVPRLFPRIELPKEES